MDRRQFVQSAAAVALAPSVTIPAFALDQNQTGDKAAANDDGQILGQGNWKFQHVPGWGIPENPPKIINLHEMAQGSNGHIYCAGQNSGRNILVYEPDGTLVRTIGDDYTGGHGLIHVEENGEEFLWVCNSDGGRPFARKITLDGKTVLELGRPKCKEYEDPKAAFVPTELEINPANGDIYLADGYGSSYLTRYNSAGEIQGCYGGGMDFRCMHGVRLDSRDASNPHLWLTSRDNNQMRRMSLNGELLEVLFFPGAWLGRANFAQGHVFIPVIWANAVGSFRNNTGFVIVLDENNQIASLIGGEAPDASQQQPYFRRAEGVDVGFINPHDAFVDADGDLYVPQWASGGTFPLKFTRVKADH